MRVILLLILVLLLTGCEDTQPKAKPEDYKYRLELRETVYLTNEKPTFENGMICVRNSAKQNQNRPWQFNQNECASIGKDNYWLKEN